jgi:hypothetical protein
VTYDALGRAIETNNGGYAAVVYAPNGAKFAFMNGSTVQQYRVPVAGCRRPSIRSLLPKRTDSSTRSRRQSSL